MRDSIKYIIYFVLGFIVINFIGNKILLEGIKRFYGLNQQSELLLIGHSHLMLAIDKEKIERETELKISKYTREGVNVEDRYYMVEQYLESDYSDSLKLVFYGVDQFTFIADGLSSNSYQLFYPFMDELGMRDFIRSESASEKEYFSHKLFPLTRYSDVLINASFRGWRSDFSNYKYGHIDVGKYKEQIKNDNQFNRPLEVNEDLYKIFDQTISLITDRGIKVVLVNTPILDLLNQVNRESYGEIIELYKDYADIHEGVEYLDFNPIYSSDYKLFYDPIHLNPEGQQVITSEIISWLKKVSL